MPKINLFGKSNKLEFAPIGTEETGVIHLLKRDRLKVKENPIDLQVAARKQAEMIALISTAAKRLATEKAIDIDSARDLFFPRNVDGVFVMPQVAIVDYLDLTEKAKYFEIDNSLATKYRVASLFIKYRLGYHVAIVESAKAKSADLVVAPLQWGFAIGDSIQFDGFRAEVTEAASVGDEQIYIKPLPQKLSEGAIGFLIDFETNAPKVGLPSWTDADTNELDEAQIDLIYAFYQEQIGLRQPESSEGKSEAETSIDSSTPELSTGSSATAESNVTELATRNSRSQTLKTATVS